ncbi:MAG TPA: hypothetical protein VGE97_01725, partial [Nitrososphaera sp.]
MSILGEAATQLFTHHKKPKQPNREASQNDASLLLSPENTSNKTTLSSTKARNQTQPQTSPEAQQATSQHQPNSFPLSSP